MNKKLATILALVFIFIIFLLTSVFIFVIQPRLSNAPDKGLVGINQSSPTQYTANFQISNVNPIELKFTLNNPPEKGITGIQIYLKIDPSLKSQLKITDIIETLPKPWQYVRKEFTKDNEILIEVIYLQPGISGDISKEFSLAKINLPSGSNSSEISLDWENSKLLGKQSGLEISFNNKIYSK